MVKQQIKEDTEDKWQEKQLSESTREIRFLSPDDEVVSM